MALFARRLTIVTCTTRVNSFVNEWACARLLCSRRLDDSTDPKRHNGVEIRSRLTIKSAAFVYGVKILSRDLWPGIEYGYGVREHEGSDMKDEGPQRE